MAKPEWGVKRLCPACATRFYDLNKDPVVCPACEAEFDLAAINKPRRGKAAAAPAKKATKAQQAEAEETEEAEEEDVELVDLDRLYEGR